MKNGPRLKLKSYHSKLKFLFQKHWNIYFSQAEDHCGFAFICQNLSILLLQCNDDDNDSTHENSTPVISPGVKSSTVLLGIARRITAVFQNIGHDWFPWFPWDFNRYQQVLIWRIPRLLFTAGKQYKSKPTKNVHTSRYVEYLLPLCSGGLQEERKH